MTWMVNAVLLTAAPVLPIALVAAWLLPYLRRRMSVLLIVAPFPALAASVLAVGPAVTFWRGLVPMTLSLDVPRAILLGVCAALWVAAAVYSVAERHGRPVSYQFAVCWLLTLAGNVGVFVTADLASFFLSYTLVSIPAYGLITDDDTSDARRAGAVYMAYTVLGETLLLMAFALLAAATPGGALTIRDVLAALAGSPWRAATLALLISGFGMKIGLVSLHVWMPLAYRAAPIPAASVLSGAAVNAGVIGLIRFLPFGVALPMAGTALATVGFIGAFYGVAVGLTQVNPKIVLAYSSVSQMGLIAAVLGVALAAGDPAAGKPVLFYAANHTLVKGALFLGIGLAAAGPRRQPVLLLPAFVLVSGLAGLPLTGGALAKLALKGVFGSGLPATLSGLSAAATTLLMLHFMRLVTGPVVRDPVAAPIRLTGPYLVLAGLSVVIPWILYPLATGASRIGALARVPLWGSLWPVLLGVLLASLLYPVRDYITQIPHRYPRPVGVRRVAIRYGEVIEYAESELRRWQTATVSVLLVAALLGVAMLIAR